jgi:hypothetical protein
MSEIVPGVILCLFDPIHGLGAASANALAWGAGTLVGITLAALVGTRMRGDLDKT